MKRIVFGMRPGTKVMRVLSARHFEGSGPWLATRSFAAASIAAHSDVRHAASDPPPQ